MSTFFIMIIFIIIVVILISIIYCYNYKLNQSTDNTAVQATSTTANNNTAVQATSTTANNNTAVQATSTTANNNTAVQATSTNQISSTTEFNKKNLINCLTKILDILRTSSIKNKNVKIQKLRRLINSLKLNKYDGIKNDIKKFLSDLKNIEELKECVDCANKILYRK